MVWRRRSLALDFLCVRVRGRVVYLGRGLGFPTSCVVLGSGGWVGAL